MTVLSDASAHGVGGGGAWPPGFRFHPTDEELVLYYLKRKMCRRRLKIHIIAETDVYKWDPEELPGLSVLKTGDRQWFFFSPRDRKYPNGARSNRATRHGYWKATGKDRNVTCNSRTVGVKKTLVYYKGRAPTGERTDWVMHEYTLDEEELQRCQNVQDYYALYKVYKKSGPGPKNGEQYGAPFKEEDWADDDGDYPDVNYPVDQEISVKQLNEVASTDNLTVNDQIRSSLNDIEEIMNKIADEPKLDQPQHDYNVYTVHQVVGEEETQSTMVDPSTREVVFPEPTSVFHTSGKQYNMHASFDFTQSTTSQLQPCEAPEVISAPDTREQDPHISEEDFLEIDDLIGPEPTFSNIEKPVENLQFEEIDGLSEFDLYHDAAMFLRDMGPIDQGMVTHPHMNTLGSAMINQFAYQSQPHPDGGMVSHPFMNSLGNDMVNHLDYQLHPHLNGADQVNSQLWTHDQSSVYASPESNEGAHSLPNSGVVYGSTNVSGSINQNAKESGGATSQFSSALWAFVESIPTAPASASESVWVNRAFERMPSFGRVRVNARNENVSAGNGAVSMWRAGINRGLLFCSVLGAVCAVLWMLIGERCVSS